MEENIHGSFDIEDPPASLESLTQELKSLPLLSTGSSIFRVPKKLRCVNKEAYTPRVVSIGPLHHGAEDLEAMEAHKMRYLNDFITHTQVSLEYCVNIVKKKERELRACYEEDIGFNSEKFVKIILLDTTFTTGVLLKSFLLNSNFPRFIDESDRIFYTPWMIYDVTIDMMLIENQLPFFILNDFYEIWNGKVQSPGLDKWPSIYELSHKFFREKMLSEEKEEKMSDKLQLVNSLEVKHFVDFLRFLHLPSKEQERGKLQSINLPKIAELHSAGVKFEVGSHKNLFELQFDKGILQIPKIQFTDNTEAIIRNLVAFEQYRCREHCLTDFAMIMDSLVDTEKDVDLLVRDGIFENYIGNNAEVASIINKLTKKVSVTPSDFHFVKLCERLNSYYRSSWHKWKANLRENYFNTPWAIISFIAAVALLILTLIQTVCSVISMKSSNPNGQ